MTMTRADEALIDGFQVRRMGLSDLDFVMQMHGREFPTNVIGRLGPRLLRAYYRTFLDGPEVWAQVGTVGGRPVAYLVGVLDLRVYKLNRRRHHFGALLYAGLFGLVRNPWLIARLFVRRTTRLSGADDPSIADADRRNPRVLSVLSHVAVDSSFRRQGIGGELVAEFIEASRAAEVETVTLATLEGDAGAGAFYSSRGWDRVSASTTADGRRICIYELPLRAPEAAP